MTNTIDRNSSIPLYHQLKRLVYDKIEQDEWQVGDMIPTELELQSTYGLSRTTVRLALTELVSEGQLTRQRGRGTFIASPKVTHNSSSGKSLSQYLFEQGTSPSWEVLRRDWLLPEADVRDLLKLDNGDSVYCVELLFMADDDPIGHHTVYVPKQVLSSVDHDKFDDDAWLTYMRELPLQHTISTKRTVEATLPSETLANLLNIDATTPILSLEAVSIDERDTPVQLVIALFNGHRFKYQVSQ